MADIRQAIEYVKSNPNSAFATELRKRIESGSFNKELADAGLGQVAPKESTSKSVLSDIKDRGEKVQQAISGEGEFKDQSAVRRGTEAFATVAGAPVSVAYDVAPKPVQQVVDTVGEGVSKVIKFLGEKLGSTQLAQDFVTKHPEAAKYLEEAAGTAGALGETAGNILAAEGTAKGVQKTVDVVKKVPDVIDQKFATTASTVKDFGTELGDKFAAGLSKVDQKTKTVLSETPKSKIQSYISQGEEALKDPRSITPLEQAGQKASAILKDLKSRLDTHGNEITTQLQTVGGTKVGNIVNDTKTSLRQKLYEDLGGIIDENGKVKDAPNRSLKFNDASDKKLIQDTDKILARLGENPTLRQVDDAISNIQDQLFKRKSLTAIPVNTQVEATLKGIIKNLNSKIQKIGGEDFAKAKGDYSRVKTIFDALNKNLGADGNKGGTLLKKFFSPSDAGTKKLFDAIKKETGIDLAQDAVTAKWVMDTLGDVRSKSLLEGNIPTSASGVASKVVNYTTEKIMGEKLKKATLRKGLKYGKDN